MADLKYKPVPHNHTDFLATARQRPGFNDAYDSLELEYTVASQMLRARAKARRVSSYLSPYSCGQPLNIVVTRMRLDDAVTFRVESDRPNRRPVACVA